MAVGIVFLMISKKNLANDLSLEPEKQIHIKNPQIYIFILGNYIAGSAFYLSINIIAKKQIILGFEEKYHWEAHCHNPSLRDTNLHLQLLPIFLHM